MANIYVKYSGLSKLKEEVNQNLVKIQSNVERLQFYFKSIEEDNYWKGIRANDYVSVINSFFGESKIANKYTQTGVNIIGNYSAIGDYITDFKTKINKFLDEALLEYKTADQEADNLVTK